MGYRLFVVLCAIVLIGGCAAFDHDNEPYAGFDPSEVPLIPGANVGAYNGYYSGSMTLDSNSCVGVSDEVSSEMPLALDVIHLDNTLNITFEDETLAAGELKGNAAIFMLQSGSTKHVYYLTFSDEDETVTGSCEVIEADAEGQYSDACASYSISLVKGEKPAEDEEGSADDSDAQDDAPQGDGSVPVPWELPGAPGQ
ncbi:MAG: hypothetical protein ABH871_07725 [Pseudomonadota bacterium]